MILQTPELSPNHKATIDDLVGGELHNQQKTIVRSGIQKKPTVRDHQAAVDEMRYQLYMLDRSQRRPSIEDYISDFLEKPGTETPR